MSAKRGGPWHAVLGVVLAALLVSCGGEAVDPFRPDRITAFGDEWSMIDDGTTNASPYSGGSGNGMKYTVNSPAPNNCQQDKIWIQIVSDAYGKAFEQCRGGFAVGASGRTWAEFNARVDDIAGQITAFERIAAFGPNDLVLMMAGMHDVLDLYINYKSASPAPDQTLLDAASGAGRRLGAQVVRITNAGAKVIIADLPDVGRSPYGNAELANGGAMLTRLTDAFNDGLLQSLAAVRGGGHAAGLVQAADLQEHIFEDPNAYGGFLNLDQPVCKQRNAYVAAPAAPPDAINTCTDDGTATGMEAGTNAGQWLWADSLHYTPGGHTQLGNSAVSRAFNNPF